MNRKWVVVLSVLAVAASFFGARDVFAQDRDGLKVALVFDIAGRGDGGFNDSAYRGLQRAVSELGVKAAYYDPGNNLEVDRALNQAAASDAAMIIGVGFQFSDKLDKLAAKYPDKKFACIDYSARYDAKGLAVPVPANLAGLAFKEEEGSYLVGAIAALKSRTGTIGFIGGMASPLIRKFEAGYTAGAKAVRPDIRVRSKYVGITIGAFNDPEKAYRIATQMYKGGADIIYHASGASGPGLFRAAKEMKRLAIGVDRDESAKAPGLVLTSMTKNVDVAVFETARSFVRGDFPGGLRALGLKENGVGFVYDDRNRRLIPRGIYNRVVALREKIVEGELAVPVVGQDKLLMSRRDLREILASLHRDITKALNGLDGDIRRSAGELSGRDLRGDYAYDVLKRLHEANPYIVDCETVSDRGIMLAVEPPEHRTSEGADISKQAHMVRLFKTRKPVMSDLFRSVEGPETAVIHQPIFSGEHRFTGSVSALFVPETLLSGIIGPVTSTLPVDIFVMQKDGLIVYDMDPKQIGRNTFTDPLYKPFTELVALAKKVVSVNEGAGAYRFYRNDSGLPVAKVAYWRTIALHGTAWRLVITCGKDNIEG